MRDDLRERRERTWELFIEMGLSFTDTVAKIASEFDEKEATIKSDIQRMPDWLGKLDEGNLYSGVSRLRELRQARQRLRQYEMEARQEEDPEKAARINQKLRKNLEADIKLSQRLGLTNEEPQQIEVSDGLDPEDEALLDEFSADEETLVDLEENR